MAEVLATEVIQARCRQRFPEDQPAIWIEQYARIPDHRDRIGLKDVLLEFENWTSRTQWLL